MPREETTAAILETRIIAILRLESPMYAVELVRAIHDGGIACIEISLNTPRAVQVIADVSARLPEVVIGAGTVCTVEDARASLEAGARFLVSPATLPELIPEAHAAGAPVVMGAFSPTEMHVAARAGADFIKLFPAAAVGPDYLKAVLAPFPHLRVVPTGGIDTENAATWLSQGAVALGVGGALTDRRLIEAGRFDDITAHARALVDAAESVGRLRSDS